MGAHMERLLARMGRDGEIPERQRVLELNANHPAVQALHRLYDADPTDGRAEDIGQLLFDQALLAEGTAPEDPNGMARRINKLIEAAAGG